MQIPWLSCDGAGTGVVGATTVWGVIGSSRSSVFGTESQSHITIKTPGTLSFLWIRITISATVATATMTTRKNSGAGNQTVSIGAATTGEFSDVTNSDSLSAGDEWNWEIAVPAGGGLTLGAVRSVFAATSNSMMWHVAVIGPSQSLNGVTQFYPLNGFHGSGSTTEANWQHTATAAATFGGLGCQVRTNTKGGNSFLRLRKNGGNGNSVVTIGGAVTGLLQDVTNTDSVSVADLTNYSIDFFADANALRFWTIGVEAVSSASQGTFITPQGDLPTAIALSVTTYFGVGNASASVPATAELNVRQDIPIAGTVDKGNVYIVANTLVGDTTFRLRKNGADAAVLMTVGTATTGWFSDASNSESWAANDEASWQVITPAVGTSIQFNNLSARWTTPSVVPAIPLSLFPTLPASSWRPVEYHSPRT